MPNPEGNTDKMCYSETCGLFVKFTNKLFEVPKVTDTFSYAYNGLGDRVNQTVNEVTTDYVLDIQSSLTQVLQNGTNTYLYGVNRIAQVTETQTDYFLPNALGR